MSEISCVCAASELFSVIAGLLYMLLKHFIDRYNIYFAYRPSKINRRIHMTAINFVITSLFILQLMLLVFIVLRAGAAVCHIPRVLHLAISIVRLINASPIGSLSAP